MSIEAIGKAAFIVGWDLVKSEMSDIAALVEEIRSLVENEQINPLEATHLVAESNYPNNRKAGHMLWQAYVETYR